MTGRQKCKMLKELRKRIAEANNIPFETFECTSKGYCQGYCPRCNQEVDELSKKLNEIERSGGKVIYPQIPLDEIETESSNDGYADCLEAFTKVYTMGMLVKDEPVKGVYKMSLEELGLSVRTYNCLKRANIHMVEDLVKRSMDDMLKIRNLTAKCLYEVVDKLEQLGLVFKEEEHDGWVGMDTSYDDIMREKILNMTLEEMELSRRSYECLKRAGINTVRELTQKTEDDLLKVRNLGRKSLDEVINKLYLYGLGLKEQYD